MTVYTTNTVVAPGSYTFGSTPQERLRIDSGGNVGINTGGPFGASGTIHAPGGVITDADKVTERELNSDVFNTPVDTLINLWVTKYAYDWVDVSDVMDDTFYALVFKRLRSLGELEVHYLTDRSRYVCRMPE